MILLYQNVGDIFVRYITIGKSHNAKDAHLELILQMSSKI